jgi:S1-C subfamily serine protease
MGDFKGARICHHRGMNTSLSVLSNEMADTVAAVTASVVQVQGARRPASGVVHADGVVVTTASALGRGDAFRVRRDDGTAFDAELAGWDPATGLAVLKVQGLGVQPATVSPSAPRVGHIALSVARSWSNVVTASAGIVAVIGGPLQTGHRRAIAQIIRTTAPMHDGFAGGAFVEPGGKLLGIATAASIRGLGVVIPAAIAWDAAKALLQHGGLKRGYLGLAGQPVHLPEGQRGADQREQALLIVGVTPDSPAARAGLLVGDVLLEFDGQPVTAPDDLLDLLVAERIGRTVPLGVRRGAGTLVIQLTVGERPNR